MITVLSQKGSGSPVCWASSHWGRLGAAHCYAEAVYLGGPRPRFSFSAPLSLLVFSRQPVCLSRNWSLPACMVQWVKADGNCLIKQLFKQKAPVCHNWFFFFFFFFFVGVHPFHWMCRSGSLSLLSRKQHNLWQTSPPFFPQVSTTVLGKARLLKSQAQPLFV